MATAASASPAAAFGAKTPGAAPSPASAFPRPSPRALAAGRLQASLHLGGASTSATGSSSSVAGNASGIHLAAPVLAPLAVPKMSGAVGAHKNVLLFHCEEMRELAEQVVTRNDDIELRSISWRPNFASGQPSIPNRSLVLNSVGTCGLWGSLKPAQNDAMAFFAPEWMKERSVEKNV